LILLLLTLLVLCHLEKLFLIPQLLLQEAVLLLMLLLLLLSPLVLLLLPLELLLLLLLQQVPMPLLLQSLNCLVGLLLDDLHAVADPVDTGCEVLGPLLAHKLCHQRRVLGRERGLRRGNALHPAQLHCSMRGVRRPWLQGRLRGRGPAWLRLGPPRVAPSSTSTSIEAQG
jgi:hypothetical protein